MILKTVNNCSVCKKYKIINSQPQNNAKIEATKLYERISTGIFGSLNIISVT